MSFLPGLFWAGDEVSLRQGWLALGLPLPGYACVSVYYVFVFASYCARVCVSDVCMYKVWVRVLRVVFVSKWIYTTMCICSNVWVMYLFKDCVFMRMLFSAYLPSFFFTEYNRNRPCFGYNKYHQQHNYYMSSIFFLWFSFFFYFLFLLSHLSGYFQVACHLGTGSAATSLSYIFFLSFHFFLAIRSSLFFTKLLLLSPLNKLTNSISRKLLQ